MKEALLMNSNELNLVDIAWTTGYVIGQLPSQLILTKVRPSIWIPSCELVWTLLTFSLAAATSSKQVILIRFFVGLVESIFYPAAHFLLGSWYTPTELGKRAGLFHASSAFAGMFSGYLQAAVYKGLDGSLGKAGWQWLFIMDGFISLPICIAGVFLIPDSPENTRAFYLTKGDARLARKRMSDVGREPSGKIGWGIVRRVFRRWHVYALTVLYVIFINTGPSSSVNPLALWLKDEDWPVSLIVRGRDPFFPPSFSFFFSFFSLLPFPSPKPILITSQEYNPNLLLPHPTPLHPLPLRPLRHPALPPTRHVYLHHLWLPLLSHACYLDRSYVAALDRIFHRQNRSPVWTAGDELGERDLWPGCGRTCLGIGCYECKWVCVCGVGGTLDVSFIFIHRCCLGRCLWGMAELCQ